MGDAGGGYTNAASDEQPKVLSCLWEASWHGLHTTGLCKAAHPGLVLISLLFLHPLMMGLAMVSMGLAMVFMGLAMVPIVVVSMDGTFVVPTWVCGSLAADPVVMERTDGVELADQGLHLLPLLFGKRAQGCRGLCGAVSLRKATQGRVQCVSAHRALQGAYEHKSELG